MKKNVFLLFLAFQSCLAFSQSIENSFGKTYFGVALELDETQRKPFLFDDADLDDQMLNAIGVRLNFYFKINRNMYGGIGASFNRNSYFFQKQFTTTQSISSPINEHQEFFESTFGNINVDYKIQLDESSCLVPRRTEDFELNGGFRAISRIHYLKIPVLWGTTFGKQSKKLYLELSMLPTFILNKEIAFEGRKRVGLELGVKETCQGRVDPDIRHQTMELIEQNIELIDYNIENSRLDARVEIGFLEVLKKNYYKIGLFYGESITPFTNINGTDHFSQSFGAKLEFGISNHKIFSGSS